MRVTESQFKSDLTDAKIIHEERGNSSRSEFMSDFPFFVQSTE